jgi:hypothetical protein
MSLSEANEGPDLVFTNVCSHIELVETELVISIQNATQVGCDNVHNR